MHNCLADQKAQGAARRRREAAGLTQFAALLRPDLDPAEQQLRLASVVPQIGQVGANRER